MKRYYRDTPFNVAYQMSFGKPRWRDLYFVCDCNIGYSLNTIKDIDFWLDVRLELKRIQNSLRFKVKRII